MPAPRRVLHVRSSGGMLGAENVVLELCRGSPELGYEPALAVTHDAGEPVPKLYDAARARGIEAHLLRCRNGFDFRAVGQLKRLVCDRHIDLLHCHGYREDFYAAAAFLPIPKVTTNHLWKRTTPALRAYAWLDARLVRKFDRVIAVSREIHDELAAVGCGEPRLRYIPNGVDVERYTGKAPYVGPIITLVTVASLTPEKGHLHLLEAFARLPDRTGVRVSIAGDGPCESDLRAWVRNRALDSAVEFLGRRDDVPALLAQADVFVLPSEIEGLPIALLEAMAAGKACIATEVGDVPRAIEHDVTGLLVPAGDRAALAAAMERLVADPELRARLGSAARRRVAAEFSAAGMVREYCRLYDELFG